MIALVPVLALGASLFVDPCTIISRPDAGAVLGVAVTAAKASAPDPIGAFSGAQESCTLSAGKQLMLVTVVTFATPAAALHAVSPDAIRKQLEDQDAKIEEDRLGVGDHAYWAATASEAEFVAVKGASIIVITVGTTRTRAAADFRAPLRALTIKALGAL